MKLTVKVASVLGRRIVRGIGMRRGTIGDRVRHAGPDGVTVRIRHGTAFHERTNLLVQTFPGISVESQTANLFLPGARKMKNVGNHPLVRNKRNEKLGARLHTLRIVELRNVPTRSSSECLA